jgi:hypothetical protein
MEERVLELAKSLHPVTDGQAELLATLCRAACRRLDGRLRDGVTANECADAYVTAAVWLALAGLDAQSGGTVSRFSAGDVTVEKSGQDPGQLEARAWKLMAPYVRDDNFVFRGVRG